MATDILGLIPTSTAQDTIVAAQNKANLAVGQASAAEYTRAGKETVQIAEKGATVATNLANVDDMVSQMIAAQTYRVKEETGLIRNNVGIMQESFDQKYMELSDLILQDNETNFFSNPIKKVGNFFKKRDLESDMDNLQESINTGNSRITSAYNDAGQRLRDFNNQVAALKYGEVDRQKISLQQEMSTIRAGQEARRGVIGAVDRAINLQQYVTDAAAGKKQADQDLLDNPIYKRMYRATNNGSMDGWGLDAAKAAEAKFIAQPETRQVWADVTMRDIADGPLTPLPNESAAELTQRQWLHDVAVLNEFAGDNAAELIIQSGSGQFNPLLRAADDATLEALTASALSTAGKTPQEQDAAKMQAMQQFRSTRAVDRLRVLNSQFKDKLNTRANNLQTFPASAQTLQTLAAAQNMSAEVVAALNTPEVEEALKLPEQVTFKPMLDIPLALMSALIAQGYSAKESSEIVAKLTSGAITADFLQNTPEGGLVSSMGALLPNESFTPRMGIQAGLRNTLYDPTDPVALLNLHARRSSSKLAGTLGNMSKAQLIGGAAIPAYGAYLAATANPDTRTGAANSETPDASAAAKAKEVLQKMGLLD